MTPRALLGRVAQNESGAREYSSEFIARFCLSQGLLPPLKAVARSYLEVVPPQWSLVSSFRNMMLISLAKRFHAEHLEVKLGAPLGASAAEVVALERTIGFTLPQAYKEYLLWMGKDHHGIFRGSGWFMGNVIANRTALRNLLEETGSAYQLKNTDVVFFTHQGYMAAWFDAESAEADPLCLYVDDGDPEPRAQGLFSEVLLNDMRGLASAI